MKLARFIACSLIVGLLLIVGTNAHAEIRVVEPPKPPALPAFKLEDHKNQPFTRQNFEGIWSLTVIGFTHCPDVCPFVLDNLAQVISELSVRVRPDNIPRVNFVAVDPARDKENLADYVRHFNANFIGVTGNHDELKKFVEGIDGFYRLGRKDKDGDYEVQHTASVILTGPKGRIQAKLSPPLKPGEVAEYLARKQIAYRRQNRK